MASASSNGRRPSVANTWARTRRLPGGPLGHSSSIAAVFLMQANSGIFSTRSCRLRGFRMRGRGSASKTATSTCALVRKSCSHFVNNLSTSAECPALLLLLLFLFFFRLSPPGGHLPIRGHASCLSPARETALQRVRNKNRRGFTLDACRRDGQMDEG